VESLFQKKLKFHDDPKDSPAHSHLINGRFPVLAEVLVELIQDVKACLTNDKLSSSDHQFPLINVFSDRNSSLHSEFVPFVHFV
jgi:hypothetical protein